MWNYNPNATSWDGETGYWYDAVVQEQVDQMLSDVLMHLVEAENDAEAWDRLFRHFNQTAGHGDVGYQSGQKITIKLNLVMGSSHDHEGNDTLVTPQLVLSLLRQLVEQAGVDDDDITFFDASRSVPGVVYDRCKAEFPDVHFADFEGQASPAPRELVQKDLSHQIHWSEELLDPALVNGSNPAYLPTCVTQAHYFINLANLKGHVLAGITVCAKNHFGSFIADPDPGGNARSMPANAGVHPYIASRDYATITKREMDTYTPLVDLMGHAELGGKTLLYLIDGLYAANYQMSTLSADCKWQGRPFSDDDGWSSSLFASQDPVAIDSVALDVLRSEPTIQEYPGTMDEGDTVDNYLHEAALADAPLSGTFYDPEGDGVRMESLGVHEHWNNPVDRLYSGNLDPGTGIELIQLIRSAVPVLQMAANGAALDFEWNSRALEAKKYDLVAATNLAEGDWLPYHDGIRTYENIFPSGTGVNILSNVAVNGSVHFFRVVEKPSGISYLAVPDGSFENPPDNVDQYVNWRFCHAGWNPAISGNEFQLCSPGHLTTPVDGSWTALMSNLGSISQDLGVVNAGDTLTVIFYGGRAREDTNTAGGGEFNCTLRVGGSFNTVHADTRAQAANIWQAYTNTWVSTATGTLSIEFSNVSGIPWIDNISDVKREE